MAGLRGDHDNALACAGAVNRSRCRAGKDGHRFDVVRVQVDRPVRDYRALTRVPAIMGIEVGVDLAELSIGTPSTTISGWLLPTIVRMPRIWMNDEAPGSPDCALTKTFGAFAASASTTFCSLLLTIWSAGTLFRTLPSFSVVLVVPAPVITTSPSCSGFGARLKSCSMTPGLSAT